MDLRWNGRRRPRDAGATAAARQRRPRLGAERLDERVLPSHTFDIGGVQRFIPPSVRASLPPPINTVAPKVESATAIPRLGQFVITFLNDTAGLDQASLANPANYAVARAGPPGVYQKTGFVVPGPNTLPQAVTAVLVGAPSVSSGTQTVIVQINNGQRLRNGDYILTVFSGGIRDQAGRPLAGGFFGSAINLPSDQAPGTNFQANLPVSVGGLTVFKAVPAGPFFFFGFQPFPRDHHVGIRHGPFPPPAVRQ